MFVATGYRSGAKGTPIWHVGPHRRIRIQQIRNQINAVFCMPDTGGLKTLVHLALFTLVPHVLSTKHPAFHLSVPGPTNKSKIVQCPTMEPSYWRPPQWQPQYRTKLWARNGGGSAIQVQKKMLVDTSGAVHLFQFVEGTPEFLLTFEQVN